MVSDISVVDQKHKLLTCFINPVCPIVPFLKYLLGNPVGIELHVNFTTSISKQSHDVFLFIKSCLCLLFKN